ncbi:hypothetical protein UFOVP176_65 [uncultured Caudovirales phage]|uniref:Uncharacterized protein n=1 Tax=uncultured Caudovirales phage TaxID=2100421 RepID=A0A6J7WD68_9CAUD|nr:hypothetical protein UFOVP176_65 [uncultured Caudovirales phage]
MVISNIFVELHRPAYLQTDTTMCAPENIKEVIDHFCAYLPSDELSWTITVKPTATIYWDGELDGN